MALRHRLRRHDVPIGFPLVSAVIPAYNAEPYLGACLDSVQAQSTAMPLEVIVVDDGSTDATRGIAEGRAGVIYLNQPNRGPSAARNSGLARARGEFVAFLDADDLWPPDKLAGQVATLQNHPKAALVFGDCRQFDATGQWPKTQFEAGSLGAAAWGSNGTVPQAYARLLSDNFITTGSVMLRRRVLETVGGFDETMRLVEDLDLWLRIAHLHPICWSGEVCLLRRRHAKNLSRNPRPMGVAYLDLLERQPTDAHAALATIGLSMDVLRGREYLHLANFALAAGHLTEARRWAIRGFIANPGIRPLAHLLRTLRPFGTNTAS